MHMIHPERCRSTLVRSLFSIKLREPAYPALSLSAVIPMDDGVKRSVDTANAVADEVTSLSRDKETTSVHVVPADPSTNYVLPPGRLAVVFMYVLLLWSKLSTDVK